MTARVERVRIDAPEIYRHEIEGAEREARRRGFTAEVDSFGGDVRLTVGGFGDAQECVDFVAETRISVFSLNVHAAGNHEEIAELDAAFDGCGLFAEFWPAA